MRKAFVHGASWYWWMKENGEEEICSLPQRFLFCVSLPRLSEQLEIALLSRTNSMCQIFAHANRKQGKWRDETL